MRWWACCCISRWTGLSRELRGKLQFRGSGFRLQLASNKSALGVFEPLQGVTFVTASLTSLRHAPEYNRVNFPERISQDVSTTTTRARASEARSLTPEV
jgi:hypothetical protein